MIFRTKIEPKKSEDRISYDTPVMLIGSCFSDEIGKRFLGGKMDALINPFGTLYNPLSVATELDIIIRGLSYGVDDLYLYKKRYLSFNHDTSFSSSDPEKCVKKINLVTEESREFLLNAEYLFITFGTARIYRLTDEKRVVANCHKLPASEFERELLTVKEIVEVWLPLIDSLVKFNKSLKIYFTVSPVRHWKDGAHGNQISKAVLLLAIEKLIEEKSGLKYLPSYELMLDDLRDYRFYGEDMVHPNSQAIDYIWKYITEAHFDTDTLRSYHEISRIGSAISHRLMSDNRDDLENYGKTMLDKISILSRRYPGIDFSVETGYFQKIIDESGA